ncbi:MAG: protein kinase [Planctomycetota bacterium]
MSSPDQPQPESVDPVADLVARVILALECEGNAAAEALFAADPRNADAARARIKALRAAGMLRDSDDKLPARIGPFRILERLGRGGMGEVFLAEQREPVERRVALKVIRAGMDSREVLARFAAERQALALFDHPNIAKIHDAGVTADGRPYLVMEYVSGIPITRYCDERGLDTEARIALFVAVCETIQHAHQRGILHRDLKPSNILVADRGSEPWPKIIDFGVAKSTQRRLGEQTLYTEVGRLLGTPEYMSPEQAQNRVDLDTRTDVYSLGAILYELLTGKLPIDSTRLRTVGQGEMERILLEEEPPTPSTRISTLGESAGEVAARRRTDPGTLRRRLRGDLDWITMKALERDRNRRYASADALAADLRRHLGFEPVTAGPPGAWYRLSRFARRHRAASVSVATIVLAMAVGLVVSISFWREARAAQINEASARAEAEKAFDTAIRAADEILVEVGGDRLRRFPGLAEERRRLLDRGLAFCRSVVDHVPSGSSRVSAAGLVQSRIAWFQAELGLDKEALATLDAIEIPSGDSDEALGLRSAVGGVRAVVCDALGDNEGAAAGRRMAATAAHALATAHPDSKEAAIGLAIALGRLAHALKVVDATGKETRANFEEANRRTRALLDRDDIDAHELPALLRVLADHADWLVECGEPVNAKDVLDALEAQLRRFIARYPNDSSFREELAPTLQSRARTLLVMGQFDPAEKDIREAIQIREKLVQELPGDQSQSIALATAKSTLAKILVNVFRFRESLELLKEVVAIDERRVVAEPDSPKAKVELGWTLGEIVQTTLDWRNLKPDLPLDDALAASARAKEIAESLGGDPATLDPQANQFIAQYLFSSGRLAELQNDLPTAAERYQRAIDWSESVIAIRPDIVPLQISLEVELRAAGRVCGSRGDMAGARKYLARAIEIEDGLLARGVKYLDADTRLRDALVMFAQACLELGDLEAAEAATARLSSLTPQFQVANRQASTLYLAIARKLTDPARHAEALQHALDLAIHAKELLAEAHGGNGGSASVSYQITLVDVLSQIAAVRDARGEAAECDGLCAEMLDTARALAKQPGRDRDKARLKLVYDTVIGYHTARGDQAGADRLRAQQQADLGGG